MQRYHLGGNELTIINPNSSRELYSVGNKYNYSSNYSSFKLTKLPSNELVYISTDEGLLSHFRQLQEMWSISKVVNRNIITPYFMSSHFPDVNVSMCKIFEIPSEVTCLPFGPEEARLKYKCIEMKNVKSDHFDFRRDKCISGSVNLNYGFNVPGNKNLKFKRVTFDKSYRKLYSEARLKLMAMVVGNGSAGMNEISYLSKALVVVHWRRGDQLGYRCQRKLDTTVNCRTPEEFITTVKTQLTLLVHSKSKTKATKQQQNRPISMESDIIYVATNENNTQSLTKIRKAGFKTFDDLNLTKLNVLDRFVVELLLVCNANYFIHFGFSEMAGFSKQCRTSSGKKNVRYLTQEEDDI
mmetsp:Transcript_32388/g.44237  ORF Transcript_32388/g.44237 Transcript_32388/m.44237 type:complete len:354 (-) Transcript_32388:231-1292(-)